MTRDTFEQTLDLFMVRHPFRPFMVKLHGGERFEIDHPRVLAFSDGKGVFLGPGGIMRIFDNEGVVQIIDAPAHAVRSKKPKK
jgi:hypothetical protein